MKQLVVVALLGVSLTGCVMGPFDDYDSSNGRYDYRYDQGRYDTRTDQRYNSGHYDRKLYEERKRLDERKRLEIKKRQDDKRLIEAKKRQESKNRSEYLKRQAEKNHGDLKNKYNGQVRPVIRNDRPQSNRNKSRPLRPF